MEKLFIHLASSPTGAIITVIALLLVAAIIGYFTAWFYAGSVYKPVIKGLEEDKESLKREVAGLTDDVSGLKGKIGKLDEQVRELEAEVEKREKEIQDLKKVKK